MKKSIYVISFAAVLTLIITLLICQKPNQTSPPTSQTQSTCLQPELKQKKEDNRECVNIPSKKYKLKEYDGNLAIFKSDAPNPIKITSIEIQALPLKDQELLKKGIDASSEEELNDLIEDYCS